MVHVIPGLALDLLERVVARHADAVRADDRVQHRLVVPLGDVLGEQLAINLDPVVVAVLPDDKRPVLSNQPRLAKRQQSRENRQ